MSNVPHFLPMKYEEQRDQLAAQAAEHGHMSRAPHSSYSDFIASKAVAAQASGFDPGAVSGALFPFQRDIARWALRRGRAAVFADTGLGKTAIQVEWAMRVRERTGGDVLILAPLAVGAQTVREAETLGLGVVHLVRDRSEVRPGVSVTNYDRLHRFDPAAFAGVVLDESSILKSFDGATRTALVNAFRRTPHRLACSATPAPNDHTELGNHAEFLGVMSRAEMLAMFFNHDGGSTSDWRIKRHARAAFWRWVTSWAVVVRRPSDIGHDDAGFALPPLSAVRHDVTMSVAHAHAGGHLFPMAAEGLDEQRAVRRATLGDRVAACAAAVNADGQPWVVWCELNAEADALEAAIPDAVQVAGADDQDTKEARMLGFAMGEHRVLVSKPSICGFGMNWQHCARVAFVGVSNSYEQTYQAVRRCWRFGQLRPVEVHTFVSDADGRVVANLERKDREAASLHAEMLAEMGDFQRRAVTSAAPEKATYAPATVVTRPEWADGRGGVGAMALDEAKGDGWVLWHGDCVEVLRGLGDASVHYSVFSPPFASLYTYSNSDRDMGNCATHGVFHEHFAFLVAEILRVTKPGRLASFHCMNLPTSKTRDGYIGLTDFRGVLIRAFVEAGWIYHSEVCIWKDPVTAMQRTKALGLLHKQLRKDSCMSRQGIADYLVTVRRPGDNPERVSHTDESFPVSRWQRWASPVWSDIDPGDTLQYRAAREENDERHICPLQLGVIERAVHLWSNPGDTVLDPFAGIGSTGWVALRSGRRFLGVELKRSYWETAARNLNAAPRRQDELPLR